MKAPGVFGVAFDTAFCEVPFVGGDIDFYRCFDAFAVAGDAQVDGRLAVVVTFVLAQDRSERECVLPFHDHDFLC